MATEDKDKKQSVKPAKYKKKGKTTLLSLYKDQRVFSKVKSLMEDKATISFILDYLNSQGYDLSRGSLSNLKRKMEEADLQGIPLGDLLDRRKKVNIEQVPKDNVVGFTEKTPDRNNVRDIETGTVNPTVRVEANKKFYSSEQVLDKIIEKGMNTLVNSPNIDPPIMMKAIDLKSKYFMKDSKGLSIDALQQYQVIVQAKIKAMQQVIMSFIPEDQQEEAYKQMAKAEQDILASVELDDEGKELINTLKKAGLDV